MKRGLPKRRLTRLFVATAVALVAAAVAAPSALATVRPASARSEAAVGTRAGTTASSSSIRSENSAAQTVSLIRANSARVGTAAAQHALPSIPGLNCTSAPVPEVPDRGVVAFFQSPPKNLPPNANPFTPNSNVSIYEEYGYAGLDWNTYDLGCGPDLARNPDAAIGTAVANWLMILPKSAVAATSAILGAAFSPDFLGSFDPLISNVVDTLRRTIFERWFVVVIGALGLLLIWRARQASLASSASAIGWALLVMILATMVFRWPLVAGHAADETVTGTLSAVTSGLNGKAPGSNGDAATEATANMHESLLYQAWLGGTFGNANSEVAKQYGPVIFDATALTWQQAQILQNDPAQGKKILQAKEAKFEDAAKQIKSEDPDAYQYLTGKRSDSRVGYAVLASLATLCAVPFLFVAGLLIIGALIIVRFGVMLFPAFATLGLFPSMRSLITGVASTMAAALINAVVFGIGASITVLGMGVLLSPTSAMAPWLSVILMLLLTITMWIALRPFRRLTMMVSAGTNHFALAAGGPAAAGRSAARTSGRILTSALSTFLGVSAAQRAATPTVTAQSGPAVPQRAEAVTTYQPVVTAEGVPVGMPAEGAPPVPGPAPNGSPGAPLPAGQPAALANASPSRAGRKSQGPAGPGVEAPGEIYAPGTQPASARAEAAAAGGGAPGGSAGGGSADEAGRYETTGAPASSGGDSGSGGSLWVRGRKAGGDRPRDFVTDPPLRAGSAGWTPQNDGAPVIRPGDRGFQRPEGDPSDPPSFDTELDEVFRPDPDSARQP